MRNLKNSIQRNGLMRKGLALLDRFQLEPALAAFERSRDLAPTSSFPYLWEALALADLGQYEAALEKMGQAIDLAPTNDVLQSFLGRVYLDQGDLAKAAEILQPLATSNPKVCLAEALYGIVLINQGKVEEGYQQLGAGPRVSRNEAVEARVLLASELYLQEHPGEARHFEEAAIPEEKEAAPLTTQKPSQNFIYRGWLRLRFPVNAKRREAYHQLRLGEVLCRRGQYANSLNHFEKAWQLAPNQSTTLQQLIQACIYARDYERALPYLEESKQFKKRAEVQLFQFLEGVTLCRLEKIPEATHLLAETYQHEFEAHIIEYYLGLCHLKAGAPAEARLWFHKATEGMIIRGGGLDLTHLRLQEALRVYRLKNRARNDEASTL